MKLMALNQIKYINDSGERKTALSGTVFDLSEVYAKDLIDNGWARPATVGEIAEAKMDEKFTASSKPSLPVPPKKAAAAPKKATAPKKDGEPKKDGDADAGADGSGKGDADADADADKSSKGDDDLI